MPKFLGIDCCTQRMSALVLDTDSRQIVATANVEYSDLRGPKESQDGIIPSDNALVKHSDPLMWVDALDTLLGRLQDSGFRMREIVAISGSAQQHGTVYLSKQFLSPGWLKQDAESLSDCVRPMLSRQESPTWMDSSTFDECRAIDEALGGEEKVREKSGSSATERFAAAQIRQFAHTAPEQYADTAVIHLVSSFLCSLLTGTSTSIECCDAAGMNLMNLQILDWDADLIQATAPELQKRLPEITPSSHKVGTLHPYFQRYGLGPIPVVAWTGDNPSSLIGTGCWKPGAFVVSLGTSDNFFTASDKFITNPNGNGHLFLNPAGRYMPLNCFKNGSCARDFICRNFKLSWHEFDRDAFELTTPGNNGNIMLPYFTDEITPQVMNVGPVYEGNSLFKSFKDAAAIVRALVEAQAMTMRLHTRWFNQKVKTLIVTGFGSDSAGVCQVLADVFGVSVERLLNNDSAAQGAAMRAAHAVNPELSWGRLTKFFCEPDTRRTVNPVKQNVEIYKELIHKYAELEKSITGVDYTEDD